MSKLVKNYNRILKTIESLNILVDSRKVGRRPKVTDFQVVALSLTAEYMRTPRGHWTVKIYCFK
jgi:hypothetical protein